MVSTNAKASPALLSLVDKYLEVKQKIDAIKSAELKQLDVLAKEMKDVIKKQMDREDLDTVATNTGFVKMGVRSGNFKYVEELLMKALGVTDSDELEQYGKRGKDIHTMTSGFNDVE